MARRGLAVISLAFDSWDKEPGYEGESILLAWLPLIGAIITFALRKIDLKTFLIVALVFGVPFLFVIAGVALFRGY